MSLRLVFVFFLKRIIIHILIETRQQQQTAAIKDKNGQKCLSQKRSHPIYFPKPYIYMRTQLHNDTFFWICLYI